MEVGHLRYNADFDSLIKSFIVAANKYAFGEDGIICIKVHIILQDFEKKKGGEENIYLQSSIYFKTQERFQTSIPDAYVCSGHFTVLWFFFTPFLFQIYV
jgi:hypothetical protein